MIDTPEKLERCKWQYENYLAGLEDAKYFEPYEKEVVEGNFPDQYEINLNRMLVPERIEEDQLIFLVKPSFEPEYSLEILKQENEFVARIFVMKNNYWYQYYENRNVSIAENDMKKTFLPNELGEDLFKLSGKIFREARPATAGGWILDGVRYYFIRKINGEVKTVLKHSPEENTWPEKVISLFEQISDCIIKNEDMKKVNPLLSSILNYM
jgi:hypothetical protein